MQLSSPGKHTVMTSERKKELHSFSFSFFFFVSFCQTNDEHGGMGDGRGSGTRGDAARVAAHSPLLKHMHGVCLWLDLSCNSVLFAP